MRVAWPHLFSWFEKGATVVVPSRLLAEITAEQLIQYRLGQGLETWHRSAVYNVDAWLATCWQEVRYKPADVGTLLSSSQEHFLWQNIIEQQHPHLFDAGATARLAMGAANLLAEWRIGGEAESWSDHEDAQQFQRWHKLFRRRCREQGWLARADIWRLLPNWIATGLCSRKLTVFAGFPTLTPALESVTQALGLFAAMEQTEPGCQRERALGVRCEDFDEEVERVARWSRAVFEQDAALSVGVLVPDLQAHLRLVERTFDRVFYPSAGFHSSTADDSVFHVRASPPLREHPLVASALLLLELARPRIGIADAGAILRCPFISGAARERSGRALADVELRRKRDLDVSMRDMEFVSGECPLLAALWLRVERVLSVKMRDRELANWSETFSGLLEAVGWPGDAELTSEEQEITEAWKDALSNLASLSLVSGLVSCGTALDRLRAVLARPGIRRGGWSSPVQILDSSDSAGIVFDQACVTGLSEETWPPQLKSNPLVPLSLQRACHIPGSSPQTARRERERVTEFLFGIARNTVATYSGRLSPMAERFILRSDSFPEWGGSLPRGSFMPQPLDELEDSVAPAYESAEAARGGTAIIKTQSQCPFRAFAEFRLNAKRPEDACFGFDARDRGGFLHKALQYVWNRLETQDRLRSMALQQLQSIVEEAVNQAVKDDQSSPFHELITLTERGRLQELILDWLLEIECARKQPFTVARVEEERRYELSGLKLRLRVDRIDRLKNGNVLLIDYKSGKQSRNKLDCPRPAEPQLWVYAAAVEDEVDGVFFAELKAREMRAVGYSREKHFPGASVTAKGSGWDQFLDSSKSEVERIAAGFVAGHAGVDPIRGACEYCNVKPFCRVNEKLRQEQDTE